MKQITTILLLFISTIGFSQSWKQASDSVKYYVRNGNREQAAQVAEKAIKLVRRELGDSCAEQIPVLGWLASYYYLEKEYERSASTYELLININKKNPEQDGASYAGVLYKLASRYSDSSQYAKAEPYLLKAAEINKRFWGEEDDKHITSLAKISFLYENMGLFDKAERFSLRVRDQTRQLHGIQSTRYAIALENLARLYERMGKFEQAEPLYLEVKRVSEEQPAMDSAKYSNTLNNFAIFYYSTGQYEKSEALYLLSKDIRKKVLGENSLNYALSLGNLAILYEKMGQYEKAESLNLEALQIRKKVLGEFHPDYTLNLNNLATLYAHSGRYEKAEPLYLQAIDSWRKSIGEQHPDYAMALHGLAIIYERKGDFKKAEPLFLQSKEIRANALGQLHPDYAFVLSDLGGLYTKMGAYEKARSSFDEAINVRKKSLGEQHMDYAASLQQLANLYEYTGEYKDAEPLLIENSRLTLSNMLRNFAILSEKEKGDYIQNTITSLEINNSFLYNHRNASSGVISNNLDQQLAFKSIILADTRNILSSLAHTSDSSLRSVAQHWKTSKAILANQYSLPSSQRRSDLKEFENNTEELEKEISRRSAGFRQQQSAEKIQMLDITNKMEEDEVVIEFVRFRLSQKQITDSVIYAAYLFHKKDSVPVFIPLFEEGRLQELFDKAGTTTTDMVSSFYRGLGTSGNTGISAGKELYQLLWQPLEPWLKGIKKISYAAAGKLYSIAFHALQADSLTLLLHKYKLKQYASTREIALRKPSSQELVKPRQVSLFGNARFTMDSLQLIKQKTKAIKLQEPISATHSWQTRSSDSAGWKNLPGTATEINKIRSLFERNKIKTSSFSGEAASEEHLKSLSGNSPQVLHIATHGFTIAAPGETKEKGGQNNYTEAEDPLLRTGLILAGGNYAWSGKIPIAGVEDGIVTAYEISQLDLSNTELVVLSACETALGDVKGTEGVFGLQRAFKMAGVKKMIVSLWQVPDKETAELMTAFYTYWLNGKTINDAFTQAQLDMSKKYTAFYWAAFILIE